jgi:hypothetical protein
MMDFRIRICREPAGGVWSVSFPPGSRTVEFSDLATGLAFAKRECRAAPALIELFSDGLYIGVPQPEGWPHELCPPAESAGMLSGLSAKLSKIGRCLRRIVQHRQAERYVAGGAPVRRAGNPASRPRRRA